MNFRWTLRPDESSAFEGRERSLDTRSRYANLERPSGGWLRADEKTFEVNTTVARNTDLSGLWTLEAWQEPNSFKLRSAQLEAQVTEARAAGEPVTPRILRDAEWQVLEARAFDAERPLPERFGRVWNKAGTAVLLRTKLTSPYYKAVAHIRNATDENGTDLKLGQSQLEFVRREQVYVNGTKANYLVWRAIPKSSQNPTPHLKLELQVNDYGVPKLSHQFKGLKLEVAKP